MKQSARALLRPLAIGAFRLVDRLRSATHRYILILSHMRSGSSLLLHLLMTSPDISGCGERNRIYRDDEDLAIFGIKSNLGQREKYRASYSVDQINHTHFLPSESLLLRPSVIPIILLREPQGAIGSMVDVFGLSSDFGIDDAIDHYRERVTTLARYAKLFASQPRPLFLTYDKLVDETQNSLSMLKDYLELQTELSDQYSTFSFTGRQGDRSSRIQAGRVLSRRTNHGVEIDPVTLNELQAIFNECLRVAQ